MRSLSLILFLFFSVSVYSYNKYIETDKTILFEVGNRYADVNKTVNGKHTLFSIPATSAILSVSAFVETAVVGGTLTVGDDGDANGYLLEGFESTIGFYPVKDATAANTFAGAYIVGTEGSTAVPFVGGKYYSVADTIDVTISGGTLTAGKVWFIVRFINL